MRRTRRRTKGEKMRISLNPFSSLVFFLLPGSRSIPHEQGSRAAAVYTAHKEITQWKERGERQDH